MNLVELVSPDGIVDEQRIHADQIKRCSTYVNFTEVGRLVREKLSRERSTSSFAVTYNHVYCTNATNFQARSTFLPAVPSGSTSSVY